MGWRSILLVVGSGVFFASQLVLASEFTANNMLAKNWWKDGQKRTLAANSTLKKIGRLSPYKNIAVIQRRYLPKTERFEFYGAGTAVINDAFFIAGGLNLRAAYHFSEKWALEGLLWGMGTSRRSITDDLDNKGVVTSGFVVAGGYGGLDLRWTPIYGKMSHYNRRIIPFDLYFSFGLGMTATNIGHNEPTLHLGTGQVFAWSKRMAFRWDFSALNYNGRYTSSTRDPLTDVVTTEDKTGVFNNLFLSIGISYFYPEANYR